MSVDGGGPWVKVNWFVAVFVVEWGFSGAVYGGAGDPDGFMLLFSVGGYRMWYDWVSEVWFVDSGGVVFVVGDCGVLVYEAVCDSSPARTAEMTKLCVKGRSEMGGRLSQKTRFTVTVS